MNSAGRYDWRESGNAAAMLTDGAFYFSHSQIGDLNAKEAKAFRGDAELVGDPKTERFQTKDLGDGFDRRDDTEYKLLSHLATMHEPGDVFRATILSERHICESCVFVLEQFREAFPASNIEVVSGKLGYNGDEKGNKTWKYRRRPKRE